jgi:signal peptidase I
MEVKNETGSNDVDAIGVLMVVLESGNSVELTATGYSMFPTLKPGDRVIVKPFRNGELPISGSIVVYRDGNELIIHRLIEIKTLPGKNGFITRGDSRNENDRPQALQQLLGVAVSFKRGGREYPIKSFIINNLHYLVNRLSLALYLRRKNIEQYFKKIN